MVGAAEVRLGEPASAARALGDVFAGKFEMHAAEPRTHAVMNFKRLCEFAEDLAEIAGFQAAAGVGGVAVHRVAAPDDRLAGAADGFDEWRQVLADLSVAESVNDGQSPRFFLGIENPNEVQQLAGTARRADLQADRVGDAAEELHVGPARVAGAIADPRHVGAQVVPAGAAGHLAGLSLFIIQMQAFVAGEELDAVEFADPASGHRFQERNGFIDRADHLAVFRRLG